MLQNKGNHRIEEGMNGRICGHGRGRKSRGENDSVGENKQKIQCNTPWIKSTRATSHFFCSSFYLEACMTVAMSTVISRRLATHTEQDFKLLDPRIPCSNHYFPPRLRLPHRRLPDFHYYFSRHSHCYYSCYSHSSPS